MKSLCLSLWLRVAAAVSSSVPSSGGWCSTRSTTQRSAMPTTSAAPKVVVLSPYLMITAILWERATTADPHRALVPTIRVGRAGLLTETGELIPRTPKPAASYRLASHGWLDLISLCNLGRRSHRYDCGTTCSNEPCHDTDAQLSAKVEVSSPSASSPDATWRLTPPPSPPAPLIDPGWPSTTHETPFSA